MRLNVEFDQNAFLGWRYIDFARSKRSSKSLPALFSQVPEELSTIDLLIGNKGTVNTLGQTGGCRDLRIRHDATPSHGSGEKRYGR